MNNIPRLIVIIYLIFTSFTDTLGQNDIKRKTFILDPDNVERIELNNLMRKVELNINGFHETINNALVADTVLCLYTDSKQYLLGLYSGDLLYGTPIDISNRNLNEWPYSVLSDKYDVMLKTIVR